MLVAGGGEGGLPPSIQRPIWLVGWRDTREKVAFSIWMRGKVGKLVGRGFPTARAECTSTKGKHEVQANIEVPRQDKVHDYPYSTSAQDLVETIFRGKKDFQQLQQESEV